MASPVKVTSLGLFILDTFEWRDPANASATTKREESVLGGGGTYAIVGARMWLPPTALGIVVDRGNDFPQAAQDELDKMGSQMWSFRQQDRPTTRALNLYTGEHRDFKYLNERNRLEPFDFPPALRSSSFLHFCCSPTRSLTIKSQLTPSWAPTSPALVFEPIPDRCVPAEMDSLLLILPHLAVFSPNHEEAWAFFGKSAEEVNAMGKPGIEEVAQKFQDLGAKQDVVIRSGALGAFALRNGQKGVWGGLMAGLELHPEDLVVATQMAAVSASFTIEQFGLPKFAVGQVGSETWSGGSPATRLAEMKARGVSQ
ncbi:hypothetical protein RQP46_008788 [Phenoliferia psychrophenolica]